MDAEEFEVVHGVGGFDGDGLGVVGDGFVEATFGHCLFGEGSEFARGWGGLLVRAAFYEA